MVAGKRAFRARLPPIVTISTRYQTGYNVTKCHACHAKRHDNLLGNLQKGEVLQLPHIDTARPQENHSRRDTWEQQNEHFVRDLASKSTFSYALPQNRCFARSFRQFSAHLTKCHAHHGICTLSPPDAALPMRFAKNAQHDTSKVLRPPRQIRWTRPKCCARHENCNASSENVAKVLRLLHRTIFDTLQNTSECHEVPRLPCTRNEATRHLKPPKRTPSAELTIGTAIWSSRERNGCERLRTVANGCGRLRTVANVNATAPRPPDWNGNPCYAFGKTPPRSSNLTARHCGPLPENSFGTWTIPRGLGEQVFHGFLIGICNPSKGKPKNSLFKSLHLLIPSVDGTLKQNSMNWFKGKSRGNHAFCHDKWGGSCRFL